MTEKLPKYPGFNPASNERLISGELARSHRDFRDALPAYRYTCPGCGRSIYYRVPLENYVGVKPCHIYCYACREFFPLDPAAKVIRPRRGKLTLTDDVMAKTIDRAIVRNREADAAVIKAMYGGDSIAAMNKKTSTWCRAHPEPKVKKKKTEHAPSSSAKGAASYDEWENAPRQKHEPMPTTPIHIPRCHSVVDPHAPQHPSDRPKRTFRPAGQPR